jgi:hypothetical protein
MSPRHAGEARLAPPLKRTEAATALFSRQGLG